MTEHVTVVRAESVPIDSISPHPQNPRRGDMARIEKSLREFGQYAPLIVHEPTGYILAGNHRWRAAKDKLGWTHVDVQFVTCTEARALEILAMDNRSSDDGRYDDAELLALLEQINDGAGDLDAAGYGVDDLDDLLARLEEQSPVAAFDPEANQRGIDTRKLNGQDATVRSIVLTYTVDEYEQVVLGLQHIAARYELQDFSDAVARMIAELDS